MALKAGYRGVKKSFLDIINSIKLITSIGDGLDFDSGELSVEVGDGLSFDEDGKVTAYLGDGLDFAEDGKIIVDQPGSAYTKDLLYGSSTITFPAVQATEITLQKDGEPVSISDYDELIVITGWLDIGVNCIQSWTIPCDVLMLTETPTADTDRIFALPNNVAASGGTGQWTRIGKGDSNSKLAFRYTKGNTAGTGIYQIYGIKY